MRPVERFVTLMISIAERTRCATQQTIDSSNAVWPKKIRPIVDGL